MSVRLSILGAGTCLCYSQRDPSSHLITVQDKTYLLDAGPGVPTRLMKAGVAPMQLEGILISHEHVDHVGGLLGLFQQLFVHQKYHPHLPGTRQPSKPLHIIGFKGLRKIVKQFASLALLEDEYIQIKVTELGNKEYWSDGTIHATAYSVPHTKVSLGYRIEIGEVVIGYTGDTGPHKNLLRILQDADIALCNVPMPASVNTEKGFIDPILAAEHAAEANVQQLVYTHFYPELVDEQESIEQQVRNAGYKNAFLIPEQGDTIAVE